MKIKKNDIGVVGYRRSMRVESFDCELPCWLVCKYSRDEGAKPLWPTSGGRPSRADIPKCSSCGSAMKFELQILPQLLYYFRVDNDPNSLDWATIVVYTCSDSCEGNPPYKEEFAWVQLTAQSSFAA